MALDTGQDLRRVVRMFAISALCHVGFFVLMMVLPSSFPSSYRMAPQAISVGLVSLPPGEPAPAPPAEDVEASPAAEPEAPPVTEAVPVPVPEPEAAPVSVAPKPTPEKVVTSLKKKTFKKETAPKTAVQKPAPPTPPAAESRQREVSRAIDSMRQKVANQEKTRSPSGAGAASGSGTGGGGGGGGTAVLSRIENYRLEAAFAVAQNWAFSRELAASDNHLETLIRFRILPNGEITDIDIVQSSGNRYLDESAYRAVRKASPVAPHPEGLGRPYIEVGVRATPSGFR